MRWLLDLVAVSEEVQEPTLEQRQRHDDRQLQ
jgi:hypothetical protein